MRGVAMRHLFPVAQQPHPNQERLVTAAPPPPMPPPRNRRLEDSAPPAEPAGMRPTPPYFTGNCLVMLHLPPKHQCAGSHAPLQALGSSYSTWSPCRKPLHHY